MLVNSIFSFSHYGFYNSDTSLYFSYKIILLSANVFTDLSKILFFGSELTFSQTNPGFYVPAV